MDGRKEGEAASEVALPPCYLILVRGPEGKPTASSRFGQEFSADKTKVVEVGNPHTRCGDCIDGPGGVGLFL